MGIMDPNIRRRQDPAMLRAMVDAFSKAIGEELRNEPETEGDLWLGLAAGCANIGDFPRAIANSQQALNAYQSAFGSAHIKVALALDHLGKYQIANKEFEGRATAKLAVDVARKCGDPELLALCVLNAAKSFNDSGKATPEAIPLLREAIYLRTEIAPNLLACIDSTRCLVEALKALAHEGKLEEAKAILQEELVRAPKSADLLELVRTFREPVEKNNVSTNR